MLTPTLTLRFLGGAGTVTGSKTLITYGKHKVLIDCGLFQGIKSLREQNWQPVPEALEATDILLTHAHLDHCGYLPRLVADGFAGTIHSTPTTKALARIVLEDSARIQVEDADRANRYHYTKHAVAKPLYTPSDVPPTMGRFSTHEPGEWVVLNEDMKFCFRSNGHIPGSAFIELRVGGTHLAFSGDLGRTQPLILNPPEKLKRADVLVLEGTYGNRLHSPEDPMDTLELAINKTFDRGGHVLIPSFAVERTQELLYLLAQLMLTKRITTRKIYVDSPMAVAVTQEVMEAYGFMAQPELANFLVRQVELVADPKISAHLVGSNEPKLVIAGSGMITGGRILHYLARHISDPATTVILPGFQAAGTRGRALSMGAEEVKFFGDYHQVKAEIVQMNSLSGHADRDELLHWLHRMEEKPRLILINHAEPDAAEALRVKIEHELNVSTKVATAGAEIMIL